MNLKDATVKAIKALDQYQFQERHLSSLYHNRNVHENDSISRKQLEKANENCHEAEREYYEALKELEHCES
jgi:hypothetical protein